MAATGRASNDTVGVLQGDALNLRFESRLSIAQAFASIRQALLRRANILATLLPPLQVLQLAFLFGDLTRYWSQAELCDSINCPSRKGRMQRGGFGWLGADGAWDGGWQSAARARLCECDHSHICDCDYRRYQRQGFASDSVSAHSITPSRRIRSTTAERQCQVTAAINSFSLLYDALAAAGAALHVNLRAPSGASRGCHRCRSQSLSLGGR
jgi:hypothetical protein